MSWTVPLSVRLDERKHRALLVAESLSRVARSWVRRADVDVVGSYNTSNVGDRCFAVCLARIAAELGARASVQDYSRFGSYRAAGPLVFGGGGLALTKPVLRRWANTRRGAGQLTSVIGISTVGRLDDLPEEVRTLLVTTRFLSARDRVSQRALEAAFGRPVELQPDIAFSLLRLFPELEAATASSRPDDHVLGVNLNPVLATRSGAVFAANARPSPWFAANLPETSAVYSDVAGAYVALARAAISHYLARGWRVRVIPFAAEDATFARAALAGLRVKFEPFDVRPTRVLRTVASCSRFLATRFHAHVFALLARVPLWTLPYSEKCNRLLRESGADDCDMGPLAWVREPARCRHYLCDEALGFMLQPAVSRELQAGALDAARRGISAALNR